jgi:hypothetical protein
MLTTLSTTLQKYAKGPLVLLFLALDLLFVAFILPNTEAQMKATSGGVGPIDLQFFYTPEKVYSMVGAYGAAGRAVYRTFELTGDIIYPIIYTLFFSLLLSWLFRHGFAGDSRWQRLNVLPFGALLFDLLENICIVTMLTLYPATPAPLAWLATSFTMIKWSFAVVTLLLVLVGVMMALGRLVTGNPQSGRHRQPSTG